MNDHRPLVLVVHPGTLGDVLLAVEAIRGIRRAFPSHHVVWVGQSEVGKLLLDGGEVHEILGIESSILAQLFTHPKHFDDRFASILRRCTHCVCWMTDHDGILSNNLQSFGVRCIIQSPQSPDLGAFHQEERFVQTLQPWGISADGQKPRLALLGNLSIFLEPDNWRARFRFMDSPYIVMHPGSGSPHKCVRASVLAEIGRGLLGNSGRSLVVLSGPGDQNQVNNFLGELNRTNFHLVSNQSLTTAAGVLKNSALFIGHDSGISHLAAGVGTPSIVLFGPTNSAYWAPRGDHVSLIQGTPCQCAEWKQVQQCHLKPCLELSADLILQEAERVLGGRPRPISRRSRELHIAELI